MPKMLKKGIFLMTLIFLISCSTDNIEYKNIDDLMEKIRIENKLNSYPELLVDGFNLNYKSLKGKINLTKKDIGYFDFIENNENGILKIITSLPEIKNDEFEKYYVELDSKKIDYDQFKNIELKNIRKKIYLTAEKLNDKKYDEFENVLILFSE